MRLRSWGPFDGRFPQGTERTRHGVLARRRRPAPAADRLPEQAAYDAVVTRTRGALAELGTTQPQWWILHQVAGTGGTKTREEVTRILHNYLAVGAEVLGEEFDTTIARGWINQDADGSLRATPEGRAFYDEAAALQRDLQGERHAGISDEEYLTTLKVLQRFIHNTGGKAWHH